MFLRYFKIIFYIFIVLYFFVSFADAFSMSDIVATNANVGGPKKQLIPDYVINNVMTLEWSVLDKYFLKLHPDFLTDQETIIDGYTPHAYVNKVLNMLHIYNENPSNIYLERHLRFAIKKVFIVYNIWLKLNIGE